MTRLRHLRMSLLFKFSVILKVKLQVYVYLGGIKCLPWPNVIPFFGRANCVSEHEFFSSRRGSVRET